MNSWETWAWIPARGGSKGIPGKNIIPLAGKPLIAYSIEAARRCPSITRVLVSTDSPEIARVAVEHGAEVPFLRPAELAGDRAHLSDAMFDLFGRIRDAEGRVPEVLVTLYATSPFRTPALIERVVAETRQAMSVQTVVSATLDLDRLVSLERSRALCPRGRAVPVVKPIGLVTASHFDPDQMGATPEHVEQFWRRLQGLGVTHWSRMVKVDDPIMALDINEPEDLAVAEEVLHGGYFDFDHGTLDPRKRIRTPA
jgi:GTP:adenosylcobinamide-phosphate guanylyltransferase